MLIFPVAFMANTFSMMLMVIGLSLFGKPALAADFAIVHGATVALFYSFSANARSLILANSTIVSVEQILRLRFLLLLPLSVLAWLLCVEVIGGGLFLVLLLFRRGTEWVAEIFLSYQEREHNTTKANFFLGSQVVTSVLLLLVLLSESELFLPMILLWALSPLLGCLDFDLLRSSFYCDKWLFACWRKLLPHFGSTAVISISVYVFRLSVLLLTGKEMAGDLFSAFAIGGFLGSIFSQALGPTLVRREQNAPKDDFILKIFNLILIGCLVFGVGLGLSIYNGLNVLSWIQKTDQFLLAMSFSLIGSWVMVHAQQIRLLIIQKHCRNVFYADFLAN